MAQAVVDKIAKLAHELWQIFVVLATRAVFLRSAYSRPLTTSSTSIVLSWHDTQNPPTTRSPKSPTTPMQLPSSVLLPKIL
ncbi:hypothetical protein PENSPDRAFT_689410 [Peniophora sp. CONT]|nr:hypothetical protein PENSPDRAFT_689410 [Peniophora sp. CONT]